METRLHNAMAQETIMTTIAWTLFLVWGAATAGVVILLVMRALVAKREFLRIAPGDRQVVDEEVKLGSKLNRIDFWGKTLTTVSVAMVVVTAVVLLFRP